MSGRKARDPETNPGAYPEDYLRAEFGRTAEEPPRGPWWPGVPRFWEEQVLQFLRSGWVGIPFLILEVLLMTWLLGILPSRIDPGAAIALTAVGMVGLGVIYWSVWWAIVMTRTSRNA